MLGTGIRSIVVVTLIAGPLLVATPAAAQATRTWISGVGDDVNPCSRTAPCKTFAGAISKTAATGEINCLDPGGFGGVTITKSITLSCEGVTAGILVAATNGITINAAATDVVRIRGLDIEGLTNVGGSINGINFLNGAALYLTNVKINGFGGTANGFGIFFAPANNATLVVDNVELIRNGNAGSPANSGGMLIQPAAGMTAKVSVSNSVIANNSNVGVRADTTAIVGSIINLDFGNNVVINSGVGLLAKAPAATGTISAMVHGSHLSENVQLGVFANGSGATVRVGSSAITGNGTGVSAVGSATISSYGSNQLNGNTTDGTFSGVIAPQ
ncbi:MAG: hypothetical protein RL367_896 [Pseudomonadota bacterium]